MTINPLGHLRSILTPALLVSVYEELLPARKTTAADLWEWSWGTSESHHELSRKLYEQTFHTVFIPLSRIPLTLWPEDMLRLLPSSDYSKKFAVQALGLQVLLDTIPRKILRGHNERWTFGFFDVLALRLARQLDGLPAGQRIYSPIRWLYLDITLNWADAMARCSLLVLPFTHGSEDASVHPRAQKLVENLREATQLRFGMEDPACSDPRADIDDDIAYGRLVSGPIPPPWYLRLLSDFFFFEWQIHRAHEPALKSFGRYPWRNAALGRVDTDAEAEFMERMPAGFSGVSPGVAEDIRSDVEKGVWRPLEDNPPP